MPNLVNVQFGNDTSSTNSNEFGMRPMQARVFEKRNEQYILLKAPPASGKSRALMFIGLDKLINQGIKKVIVAVPEMSIGSSFKSTDLMTDGFFSNWDMDEKYNLCQSGSHGKSGIFREFLSNKTAKVLLCTHAALRLTLKDLDMSLLNDTLIAIDEFHHVSESGENQLGNSLDIVMKKTNAHVTAMTGSYFRGDSLKILSAEVEAKFKHVSYSYYEQLQSYKHLKSLGIGYHFYRDGYLSGLGEVLDVTKKTIIHIPNVNSRESTGDKYGETDAILDVLRDGAEDELTTDVHGIYHVPATMPDGTIKVLKVADLVDDGQNRAKIQSYLNNINGPDDLDIIIALNMAQEGFDWVYCEHALTIGFRSSLTQKIQIIGRATRDCEGKEHAQFTNLIAEPDASSEEAAWAVNNMLKAISVSLLMEQVLAPKVNFKIRGELVDDEGDYTIEVNTWDKPPSEQAKKALESRDTIIAELTNDTKKLHSALTGEYEPEVWLNHHIPKLLRDKYPEIEDDEIERLSELFLTAMTVSAVGGKVVLGGDLPEDAQPYVPEDADEPYTGPVQGSDAEPDKKFLLLGNKFVAIDDLNINLIASINPFQKAYEVISREIDGELLRVIQDQVRAMQSDMDLEEAMLLADRIAEFKEEHGRDPQTGSHDDIEHRLAIALQKLMVWAQAQANKEEDDSAEQMTFREDL
jgi:superfamily II DNA or RNA helicase